MTVPLLRGHAAFHAAALLRRRTRGLVAKPKPLAPPRPRVHHLMVIPLLNLRLAQARAAEEPSR